MADASRNQGFDEILRIIGPDATAMFDHSARNPTEHAPTEHAISEATHAATAANADDEELEEEDDAAAAEEEDDEEDEEVDVEDKAGV